MKKKLIVLVGIIIVLIVGVVLFINLNKKENDNFQIETNETDGNGWYDGGCKYSEEDLKNKALKYFTSTNGTKANNGEDYIAGSILEEKNVTVIINHLETDHTTTDARYVIDCITGIGTGDSANSIDFTK